MQTVGHPQKLPKFGVFAHKYFMGKRMATPPPPPSFSIKARLIMFCYIQKKQK